MFTGKNRLTLLGDDLIKTANIPSTGNVVGAYFDKQALAIVFGSPTLSGKVTPVADAATGFRLYVREVEDVSTGDIAVTVECVYGIKGALTDKAVLLKSAA